MIGSLLLINVSKEQGSGLWLRSKRWTGLDPDPLSDQSNCGISQLHNTSGIILPSRNRLIITKQIFSLSKGISLPETVVSFFELTVVILSITSESLVNSLPKELTHKV